MPLFDQPVWTDYSPTVAAGSGTFTTTVLNRARYIQVGKLVTVRIDLSITTHGSAASYVDFTVPVTQAAGNAGTIAGVDTLNGWGLCGQVTSGLIIVFKYDATFPGADGTRLVLTATYEAA